MQQTQQQNLVDGINAIEVPKDRDYGWLWEYSKFRYSQSISSVKASEDKASSLLKFTLSLAGALWLVFTYLSRESKADLTPNGWIIAGLVALTLAFACPVLALLPKKRLRPFREQTAMRFIRDNEKDSSRPQGRFVLGLMMCSDFSDKAITRTSYLVVAGTALTIISIALFIYGFSFYRFPSPTSDRQYRTSCCQYRRVVESDLVAAVVAVGSDHPLNHPSFLAPLQSVNVRRFQVIQQSSKCGLRFPLA
jgi:hypothetical protein